MGEPILTIGIPTYNRPESIKRTVKALLPQLNEKVVLKVWDNCSDTPIADLFSDEDKKKFIIERNKANIGGDANICGVIYHAETKWVWDLGDDDGPLDNAVATILNYVERFPDALFFKFNSYIEKDLHSFDDLVDICKHQWIFNNFLFISTSIYNREKLINDIQHFYVNLSSMIGQTIFILKHIEKKEEDCYFISKKIVYHTPGGVQEESDREIERGTWDALTFIKRSSIIFDIFKDKRKSLNSTLFAGIVNQYLSSIGGHGMSRSMDLKAIKATFKNAGFFNVVRYNHSALIRLYGKILLLLILPPRTYAKIKSKLKGRLNKKILKNE